MINYVNSVSFKGLHPYGTGNDGSFARAQAYGYAKRMAERADQLRRDKVMQYRCGMIDSHEFERFMKAPTSKLIEYIESPCTIV